MYTIRENLEKLGKMQKTKSSIRKERIKNLGKQDFHYDREEVFEPVTEIQKQIKIARQEISERHIQAQRDSPQTTTEPIEIL